MDFTLNEEHIMLKDMLRDFTDKELKPRAEKADKTGMLDDLLIEQAKELGLFGISIPEAYDGGGMGEIGYCVALEELSRGCASFVTMLGAHLGLASTAILLYGSEEQKQRYLKPMARGELLGAFALTESTAGSDAGGIQARAQIDGDSLIINGAKQWITNGDTADVIVLFALTDPDMIKPGGISAIIVEPKKSTGFTVGKLEKKLGIRGSHTAELFFSDLRVPKENILGRMHRGFRVAMGTLDYGRISLAAGCLGAAKELVDLSLAFAKERIQFDSPIHSFQLVQQKLADMATVTYAMEAMIMRTAWMVDTKRKFKKEAAMCKLFASDMLDRVVDHAMQIFGGAGYMEDYPIERMYRDARINRIFEGTNEIQSLVIAGELIKKGRYVVQS